MQRKHDPPLRTVIGIPEISNIKLKSPARKNKYRINTAEIQAILERGIKSEARDTHKRIQTHQAERARETKRDRPRESRLTESIEKYRNGEKTRKHESVAF